MDDHRTGPRLESDDATMSFHRRLHFHVAQAGHWGTHYGVLTFECRSMEQPRDLACGSLYRVRPVSIE